MVYDPIRDCDVPSPAATEYSRAQSYFSPAVVTPTGQGHAHGQGRLSLPPGFSHAPAEATSPSASGSRASLGNLLVDRTEDGLDRRRSSGRTSSFSSTGQPEERKPSLSMILNEGAGQSSASSPQAMGGYHSPASHQSPSIASRPLNHDGFAIPAPPSALSSAQLSARTRSPSQSHSPMPFHTPRSGQASSPAFQSYTPLPDQYIATTPGQGAYNRRPVSRGESTGSQSARRLSGSAGSMMPPQHIDLSSPSMHHSRLAHSNRDFDSHPLSGPSPSFTHLPLRSPSVSISPRAASVNLPHSTSRPSSSKGYTPQPSASGMSANPYASRSPSRDVAPVESSLSASSSRRSVSPVTKSRVAYNPGYNGHRRPITPAEVARLKSDARRNNPLRTRAPPPPTPSGSASANSSQPAEDGLSYFPTPTNSRPTSSDHRVDRYSPSGPPSPVKDAAPLRRKRESETRELCPEDREEQRRKVSAEGDFVAAERAKLVAQHCKFLSS